MRRDVFGASFAAQKPKVETDYEASKVLRRMADPRQGKDSGLGSTRRKALPRLLFRTINEWEAAGVPVGIRTYCIAMGALANEGLATKCDEVYGRMQKKGLRTNVVVYNMLMKAHQKVKGHDQVKFYWDVLNSSPPLAPDRTSYLTYLRSCLGHVSQAELFRLGSEAITKLSAGDPHLKLAVHTLLVQTLSPKTARYVHDRLLEEGSPPTIRFYSGMVKACLRAGDAGSLDAVFRLVERRQVQPDLDYYNCVLRMYEATADYAACLRTLKQLDRHELTANVTTYKLVLKTCCKASRGDLHSDEAKLGVMVYGAAVRQGFGCYSTLSYAALELGLATNNRPFLAQVLTTVKEDGHTGSAISAKAQEAIDFLRTL